MKTITLFLFTAALLFVIPLLTLGQSISIEAGYIATQYKNMQPFSQNNGGFQFGVTYCKPIKDPTLQVKTGLHYQQLDGKGEITYYNQINQPVLSFQKNQELYYLHIPALLQYNAINNNKFSAGLQAGLSYNFLLRAWQNPQPEGVNHNVTDQFIRNVLGLHAGAYFTIPLNNTYSLQTQYMFGSSITQVQKQNSGSGFSTHTLQLGLVYKLP